MHRDEENDVNGLLHDNIDYFPNLDSLCNLFAKENYISVTCNFQTVAALFKNESYYVFDSHNRDEFGLPSANGTAYIVKFSTDDMLSQHFFTVFRRQAMLNIVHRQYVSNW